MGAINEYDLQRIVLEEGLAHLVYARTLLRIAVRRMTEYARTRDELELIEMVGEAAQHVEQGQWTLVEFHPNALVHEDLSPRRAPSRSKQPVG